MIDCILYSMILNIKLTGNIPPKKNNRRIFTSKYGSIINIPSKNHYDWHSNAIYELQNARVGRLCIEEVHCIVLTFYSSYTAKQKPSSKLFDLTNKAESVMDLLVDYGLLKDDNWSVLPNIQLRYSGAREESGCDVELMF